MECIEYRFDAFRLRPAERGLWNGDERIAIPRMSFDCIVYLLEHRDRAVGRDELVAAVWGKADISDNHLNQVVARARKALGDNAQAQRVIRTVQGFGYHWVGYVDGGVRRLVVAEQDESRDVRPDGADASVRAGAYQVSVNGRRRAAVIVALVALVAGSAWVTLMQWHSVGNTPIVHGQQDEMLIVLPLEVRGSREFGWLSMGAMDLIVQRLRDAGVRAPPSETVLAALNGATTPPDPEDLHRALGALGGGVLLAGVVSQDAGSWVVRLELENVAGERRDIEARHADAIQAARTAADLLLVSIGRKPPQLELGPTAGAVQEQLQQAQAALLTNQLDLARNILADIPQTAETEVEVRLKLAEIDFRAGRIDAAAKSVSELLAAPAAKASPQLRGRLLLLRGNVSFRRSAFREAGLDFDAAVAELEKLAAGLDLCDALTRRALVRVAANEYERASADYSRARLLAEQAGDRLRVAHVEAGFGRMLLERKRLDLAQPYIEAAITQYEAFGVVERVVTLYLALIDAYMELLRWDDAWRLGERQWALVEKIADPGLALVVTNRRVRLLVGRGRLAEAGVVAVEARRRFGGQRPEVVRYLYDLEVELAWARGDHAALEQAADGALATWPRTPSFDRYALLVLLRQRALIASGRADPGLVAPWLPVGDVEISSLLLLAKAEWAAHRRADAQAQAWFERAMKVAEADGAPYLIARVAQSHGEWLLRHGQIEPVGALAGRVAVWARVDFGCALLRLEAFHALGSESTWRAALEQAQSLAGERRIPAAYLQSP